MGLQQQTIAIRREPAFEPPPRFAGSLERRLAGQATTRWRAARGDGAVPDAGAYVAGLLSCDGFAGQSILLDLTGRDGVAVETAGSAVAAVFGLAAGLRAAGPLAEKLAAACARALTGEPARFDAVLARAPGAPPTLLTRGVVLPLGDRAGRIVRAHAVVTWTEILSPGASDRLRNELDRVFAPRPYGSPAGPSNAMIFAARPA